MPKGSATTLFVSSTCYDLAQLRADIREFAEAAGLEPILSELDSFPVNPSVSTVENCLNAVRNKADLFLLVVGNRYGSITDTGRSITNLEYIEAASRGIPRFVFVKAEIITVLSIWKQNRSADFSSSVDTPQLFEFVSGLRDEGEVWVFPFSNAQEIVRTLRKQLSYLFADSLALRAKLQRQDQTALALSPDALRIYIERPTGWEYLAFAKILQDGIASHYKRRLDLELGVTFDRVVDLTDKRDATQWVSAKFTQITQIAEGLSRALNDGIRRAVGEPGQPGDIQRIEHIASRIADGYLQAIEWTLEFHRLKTMPELETLMTLASHFSANVLKEIETFSASLYDDIAHALGSHSPGDLVNFTLKLTVPDTTPFVQELQRVATLRGA
jgi:hypothetical protein